MTEDHISGEKETSQIGTFDSRLSESSIFIFFVVANPLV
jgi:hypothetical protein